MSLIDPAVRTEFVDIVGSVHVLADPDLRATYEVDWTRRWTGTASVVVRPADTAELSGVVGVCHRHGLGCVAQGGRTGLVGGSVPRDGEVIVSLGRLDHVGAVDVIGGQLIAGAGVTLAEVHRQASAAGWAFGVDLAARDNATVGGMVATNAGGMRVVRFGQMRSQVIGLEFVLADGTIISRLEGPAKDNAGYDLSQLMVGSEGTLGIVAAARLRLVRELPVRATAMIGLQRLEQGIDIVGNLRRSATSLEAAEVFDGLTMDVVATRLGTRPPMEGYPWYLIVECAGDEDPSPHMAEALAEASEGSGPEGSGPKGSGPKGSGPEGSGPTGGGPTGDFGTDGYRSDNAVAVATDPAARRRLWAFRDQITESIAQLGVAHKLDPGVPLDRLPAFTEEVRLQVAELSASASVHIFGHLGEGNLHVNVLGLRDDDDRVDAAVLELVARLGGSIGSEHGMGKAKARWLSLARSPGEIAAMQAIKQALDPRGILNRGVIFPDPPGSES
ncbi:MAG TPA: FAD-binding oxidoreductase [Acidimicrobiales bacterium]|nr:FAD-binding oxidoreductase [Acidimicrobiales bacterium]